MTAETGATTSSDQALREPTEEVVITLNGRRYRQPYTAGESVLETARRAGLAPPFSCEAGECGSCMALLLEGEIEMTANKALMPDELDEGWRLTCQGYPITKRVAVEYPE
ncbi:2Fe-2S iron-sulfur cluster binding domain-containing protein [Mycobacterium sp. SMC-2]|uniref:2Fe-2S iron-sulfur cluster-binding protein n=1 Tax=Mycobacterium sp. SMC-2 TaxID=2857058 RepID=UPI0021B4C43D|nr:2Fe-2S iron-sulfur cluster binding domain-containing protein [Mycobacterium sp. SMC-2]